MWDSTENSGFTLLEIMTAISILSVVLIAVYQLHSQTISMNISADFYARAPLLAQIKMAETEAKTLDELSGDSGDFGEEYPGYVWEVSVDDVDSDYLGQVAERLKKIDLTVSSRDSALSFTLQSYHFFDQ